MVEHITDKQLLQRIMWNDADGYTLIESEPRGQTRWHIQTQTVFRRDADNKLFLAHWRKAATEMQEHEYPDQAVECMEIHETVVRYKPVPNEGVFSQATKPPAGFGK